MQQKNESGKMKELLSEAHQRRYAMSALENVMVLMDTIARFEGKQFDTLHGGEFEEYIRSYRECHVLLSDDIERLKQNPLGKVKVSGKCKVTCEDTDTYTKACQLYRELKLWKNEEQNRIMVLNFANPYIPGGEYGEGQERRKRICAEGPACFFLWKQMKQRSIILITGKMP